MSAVVVFIIDDYNHDYNGNKRAVKIYRYLYIAAVFIGPYMIVAAVWTVADIFNGLMAIPNLIAIVAMSGVMPQIRRTISSV